MLRCLVLMFFALLEMNSQPLRRGHFPYKVSSLQELCDASHLNLKQIFCVHSPQAQIAIIGCNFDVHSGQGTQVD